MEISRQLLAQTMRIWLGQQNQKLSSTGTLKLVISVASSRAKPLRSAAVPQGDGPIKAVRAFSRVAIHAEVGISPICRPMVQQEVLSGEVLTTILRFGISKSNWNTMLKTTTNKFGRKLHERVSHFDILLIFRKTVGAPMRKTPSSLMGPRP